MAARLNAAAEDRENARIVGRESPRGGRRHRRGAHLGEVGAVHHDQRLAGRRIEESHQRHVRFEPALGVAWIERDQLGAHRSRRREAPASRRRTRRAAVTGSAWRTGWRAPPEEKTASVSSMTSIRRSRSSRRRTSAASSRTGFMVRRRLDRGAFGSAPGRDLVERRVAIDADVAGQTEHALRDDVAQDLVGAARDAQARRVEESGGERGLAAAAPSPFSSSVRTPPGPSRSSARSERSCVLVALTTLKIDASGPGVWPFESAVRMRAAVRRSPSDSTYQSARRSRTARSRAPVRSRPRACARSAADRRRRA